MRMCASVPRVTSRKGRNRPIHGPFGLPVHPIASGHPRATGTTGPIADGGGLYRNRRTGSMLSVSRPERARVPAAIRWTVDEEVGE